jgi:hypothetical protein
VNPTRTRQTALLLVLLLLVALALGGESDAGPADAPTARDPALWPFASTSPWNRPIGSDAALSADDDPRIETIRSESGRVNSNNGYSHPVYRAADDDPESLIQDLSHPGRSERARVPTAAVPASGTDGHLHVISPDGRFVYETWMAQRQDETHLVAARVERNDLLGAGVLLGGSRAYGGSAIGGLVRRWELDAGEIRHAVAISLDPSQLTVGPVWPASADDGEYPAGGTVPMGTLLAIPGDVDVDELGLNPHALAVARAVQDYGAYVVDQGAPFTLYLEQGVTEEQHDAVEAQIDIIKDLVLVVTNNGPRSIGGGGAPRVEMAPALPGEWPVDVPILGPGDHFAPLAAAGVTAGVQWLAATLSAVG